MSQCTSYQSSRAIIVKQIIGATLPMANHREFHPDYIVYDSFLQHFVWIIIMRVTCLNLQLYILVNLPFKFPWFYKFSSSH